MVTRLYVRNIVQKDYTGMTAVNVPDLVDDVAEAGAAVADLGDKIEVRASVTLHDALVALGYVEA